MYDTITQPHPDTGHPGPGASEEEPLPQWTVIGLRDLDGHLTVAGVAPGDVPMADSNWGTDQVSRYADTFTAPSADEAEALAVAHCASEDDDQDQDDEQPLREGDTVRHIVDAAKGMRRTGTIADICRYTGAAFVDWPTGRREKHNPGELIHA